jgi:hypothetical protein
MNTFANPSVHLTTEDYFLNIITESDSGWVLQLPDKLRAHQTELEELLGKVFACSPRSRENFALAQQLSLNWCFSKLRQAGMSVEDCWHQNL